MHYEEYMFNETLRAASVISNNTITYFKTDFFERTVDIVYAPFIKDNESMLWMLLPLIATILFMEFYFGRYKEEELGWNTAYGNALVLLFVSIDLFRHTYEPLGLTLEEAVLLGNPKIIIALGIFGFALLLILIDYFHFLSKKIAYIISSPTYIHIISVLGVIIVYSKSILFDWTTLFACFTILIVLFLLAELLYFIVPSYTPPLKRILTVEDLEIYRKKGNIKK
jgi:hypothetical protein